MKISTLIDGLDNGSRNINRDIEIKLNFISRRLMLRARLNATIDPKKRSGRLFDSISAKRTGNKVELIAGSSSVKYADFVEYGTSKMYPRLFLTKAYNHVLNDVSNEIKKIAEINLRVRNGR